MPWLAGTDCVFEFDFNPKIFKYRNDAIQYAEEELKSRYNVNEFPSNKFEITDNSEKDGSYFIYPEDGTGAFVTPVKLDSSIIYYSIS